jgi:hypothetical protein
VPSVVDASVTIMRAEQHLNRAASESLHVPPDWPLEVLNGLLAGERHQRLTEPHSASFWSDLRSLALHLDMPDDCSSGVETIGFARRCSHLWLGCAGTLLSRPVTRDSGMVRARQTLEGL